MRGLFKGSRRAGDPLHYALGLWVYDFLHDIELTSLDFLRGKPKHLRTPSAAPMKYKLPKSMNTNVVPWGSAEAVPWPHYCCCGRWQ